MPYDSLSAVFASNLGELRDSNETSVARAYQVMDDISHLPRTVYLPSLPDGTIDRSIAAWALEPRSELTQKNYAHDVHQFFDYWHTNFHDRSWTTAKTNEISRFLGWYRHQSPAAGSSRTQRGRSPATVRRMQAALHSIYDTAVLRNELISNPVPRGTINATKGGSKSSANWLTPKAIEDWQAYGINRIGNSNQDRMIQNHRNLAYSQFVYGTGLRRQEAGGLLTMELPINKFSKHLKQGWVPAALSKNSPYRGRAYYADDSVVTAIESYRETQRHLEVQLGQESGQYEQDNRKLLIDSASQIGSRNAKVTLSNAHGKQRTCRLQELTLEDRMHLYHRSENGSLEPAYFWLRTDGTPLRPTAWNGIFEAANRACATSLGQTSPRITPHRLRHSFALRVFAASLLANVQATSESMTTATHTLIDQGNIWIRLQNLLGHKSPDTTRDYYLEPVATLEWELIIRQSEHASIDKFFALVSALDPRIQDRGFTNAD